jgi:hypothetical protein
MTKQPRVVLLKTRLEAAFLVANPKGRVLPVLFGT